jgi:hypothetical protein
VKNQYPSTKFRISGSKLNVGFSSELGVSKDRTRPLSVPFKGGSLKGMNEPVLTLEWQVKKSI